MKIIYTPALCDHCDDVQFSVIDLETLEETHHGHYIKFNTDRYTSDRPDHLRHRPFGITWNDEHLFIANRTNLIKFDKNLNQLNHYDIYHGNPHQILEIDSKIYAADTAVNAISVFDLETEKVQRLYDLDSSSEVVIDRRIHIRELDKNHLNSLHFDGQYLYALFHNWRKKNSEILKCDLDLNVIDRFFIKAQLAHCVFKDRGFVSVLDTGITGCLVREDDSCLQAKCLKHDFIRGYASNEDFHIIGLSHRESEEFSQGARILAINKNTYERKIVNLSCDELADLRILDEYDLSHNKRGFLQ